MAACAAQPKPSIDPKPVVVTVKETPPADLLQCAQRPEAFSADAWGVLPPGVRDKLIEIMKAFGENASQADRLVNWHAPGSCE